MLNSPPNLSLSIATPLLAGLLLACATPAVGATATATREAKHPVVRAVVANTAGALTVHHAATGITLLEVNLPGPASSLVPLGDQRHVAAVVGTKNTAQLIDAGSWSEPHDDHAHSFVTTPSLVGPGITSDRPSHVVADGDHVVVFGDGTGAADRYSLAALAAGKTTPTSTVRAPHAHHGVAVPLGETTLLSTASSAGGRPDTIVHLDASGRVLARFPGCPGLHGEASGIDWAAFGCADGTLLVEGSPLRARKVSYPSALTGRVGTWNRTPSGRHLIGAYGTLGVLLLDRTTGSQHLTPISGVVHAVKADSTAAAALVLSRDGRLQRLAARNGKSIRSVQAVEPFSAPTGAPSPKLAVTGGRVAVSDPARGRVVMFDARTLRQTGAFRTPGTPAQLTLTGAAPADR